MTLPVAGPSTGSATVVIGIGNTLRRDDGVGPAVLERLMSELGPASDAELLVLDGEATRLLDAWADRALAVVVDAIRCSDPPGTIHRIEPDAPDGELCSALAPVASSHRIGLAEAIAYGRALDRLPQRLVIYGVTAANTGLGPGLTPSVSQAATIVARRITAELGWPAGGP